MLAVINTETGEIKHELQPGDRILKAQSIEKLKSIEEFKVDNFSKLNNDELQLILPELSKEEKAMLLTLFGYVRYETGLIQYKNGRDIAYKDIMKLCSLSESAVFRIIDSLVAKDLLYRGKNSKNVQFFLNPWLISKGNVISKVLKDMFKNYKIRSKDNVMWKNLEE